MSGFRRLANVSPREIRSSALQFPLPTCCPACSSSDVVRVAQTEPNPFGRLWSCQLCRQGFIVLPVTVPIGAADTRYLDVWK